MSLSDVEIAQVVGEIAPLVAGGHVGKAHATDDTVVLELGRDRLLLSASPRASRLHLTRERPRGEGGPSAFAMLLRKRFGGLRVHALRVLVPGERVVVVDFGDGKDRLIAELTGPHANLFVVDGDGKIVSSLRPSGSTSRPLTPGDPYVAPPPAPADARWRGVARFGEPPGVADRVAAHYDEQLRRALDAEIRQRAGQALQRAAQRLRRREQALLGDVARVDDAARFRKYGDLLLAHAHALRRGAPSATVPDDFEDGAPLVIPLDPALDARQNAARFYREHKRLTAARRRIEDRLAATRAELAKLEQRLAAVPTTPLDALRPLAESAARTRAAREADEPRLPYRELRSLAGDLIWVGRSAADNDALTFRHARGNDLWFHCRDAAGSHVVVPRRTKAPVADTTFVDAATLAAHFSKLAGEAQVDVTYTHVKNLRKPRDAAPGQVFVAEGRTVRVRMEAERIARLLAKPDEITG